MTMTLQNTEGLVIEHPFIEGLDDKYEALHNLRLNDKSDEYRNKLDEIHDFILKNGGNRMIT